MIQSCKCLTLCNYGTVLVVVICRSLYDMDRQVFYTSQGLTFVLIVDAEVPLSAFLDEHK